MTPEGDFDADGAAPVDMKDEKNQDNEGDIDVKTPEGEATPGSEPPVIQEIPITTKETEEALDPEAVLLDGIVDPDLLKDEPRSCVFEERLEKAGERRAEGNAAFKEGRIEEALRCMDNSIVEPLFPPRSLSHHGRKTILPVGNHIEEIMQRTPPPWLAFILISASVFLGRFYKKSLFHGKFEELSYAYELEDQHRVMVRVFNSGITLNLCVTLNL